MVPEVLPITVPILRVFGILGSERAIAVTVVKFNLAHLY